MSYSDVTVYEWTGHKGGVLVDIEARGGNRRQRGAAIAAAARKHPGTLERVRVSYSETYGFQHASYARYTVQPEPLVDVERVAALAYGKD